MLKLNQKIVAFVLINIDNEISSEDITEKLKHIDEITESTAVLGTYNIIMKIECDTSREIKDITLRSIRKLEGVNKTVTLISFETWD